MGAMFWIGLAIVVAGFAWALRFQIRQLAPAFFDRFHAWLDPLALRFIKWLNGFALVVVGGLASFSALHPNFPAEVQATLHLTPLQYMILSVIWPIVVAYLVKRAAKAAA